MTASTIHSIGQMRRPFVRRDAGNYAEAMLQSCANPHCSVQFARGSKQCPACGTPAETIEPGSGTGPTLATSRDGNLTEDERRGRDLLTTLLILNLLLDLTGSVFAVSMSGASLLPRVVRLGLNLLLCSELYRGSLAARRVAVGLCILTGLLVFVLIWTAQDPLVTVIGGAGLLAVVAFAGSLVHSPQINAFMAYQRRKQAELIRQFESPKPDQPEAQ